MDEGPKARDWYKRAVRYCEECQRGSLPSKRDAPALAAGPFNLRTVWTCRYCGHEQEWTATTIETLPPADE